MTISVTKTPEAAGAGAAMLAAKAAGMRLSPLEIGKTYVPSDLCEAYKEKYKKYKAVEKKLWSKGE